MLSRKTYNCTPGGYFLVSPDLAYIKKLIMVSLNENVYNIIVSNDDLILTGLTVRYSPAFGTLFFNDSIPFESGNTINLIYET